MQPVSEIILLARTNKARIQNTFRIFPREYQKHKCNALVLLLIECPEEVCRLLSSPFSAFEKIINSPVYKYYSIDKKSGGKRKIFAPEKSVKQLQKRLNYYLQGYYLWIKPAEVHGFTINPNYLGKRCNIAENARVHTGKNYVLNIDLKDFFPNISAKKIKNLFLSPIFNYPEQIATALTLLTTYEGKLPTGAPTSPALSNFICLELDANLRAFCEKNALKFTRYADDITFSATEFISQETVAEIIEIIRKNGFEINEKKMRMQSRHLKQTVTGLTVNEKVNINRKLLKRIRAMLHDMTTNGVNTATQRHFGLKYFPDDRHRMRFIHRLEGYINFIGQIRGKGDPVYCKMKAKFDIFLHSMTKSSR